MSLKSWLFTKGTRKWLVYDMLARPAIKIPLAFLILLVSVSLKLMQKQVLAVQLLMMAHRYHPNRYYAARVMEWLDANPQLYKSMLRDDVGVESAASRSIIVKMPEFTGDTINKGVIIITFTDTLRYFFYKVDIFRLQKYFYVVLEPSWAGYCLPEILFWCATDERVLVEATEITDREFLRDIARNLVPLDFGASDWVNYNMFYPIGLDKIYDSVYVANYSHVKRLHAYFRALNIIKRRGISYKGAIVCASWGGERDVARAFINLYGVADILDVHESLNAAEVNRVVNQSKCNVLLSLKEGSNRSLFEAMFCDVPAILLKENIGVNKSYINDMTGMLVAESALVDAMIEMKSSHVNYNPRTWAMKNIAPEVTTRKLMDAISKCDANFEYHGRNVWVKTNKPEVAYMGASDSFDRKKITQGILSLFTHNTSVENLETQLMEFSSALTDRLRDSQLSD